MEERNIAKSILLGGLGGFLGTLLFIIIMAGLNLFVAFLLLLSPYTYMLGFGCGLISSFLINLAESGIKRDVPLFLRLAAGLLVPSVPTGLWYLNQLRHGMEVGYIAITFILCVGIISVSVPFGLKAEGFSKLIVYGLFCGIVFSLASVFLAISLGVVMIGIHPGIPIILASLVGLLVYLAVYKLPDFTGRYSGIPETIFIATCVSILCALMLYNFWLKKIVSNTSTDIFILTAVFFFLTGLPTALIARKHSSMEKLKPIHD